MTKLIISGCCGRMGRALAELAADDSELQLVAGIDPVRNSSCEFPVYANPMEFVGAADCLIDFSSPQALDDLLRFALARKMPMVLATTGYSNDQILQIDQASRQVPVFRSANMSYGVNVLMDLVQRAAKLLEGYDIEIVERHHNQKVDAPSGTALMLADAISESVEFTSEYIFDRSQRRQKRSSCEIGISSVRGGTIAGDHTVIFAGHNEVLELHHSAQSRELFASGALRAAKYLARIREPGLYSMQDLIQQEQ